MSGKNGGPRAYARLTKAERRDVERGLDRGESLRSIADGLGRAPSTVQREVARNRVIEYPQARRGEPCPDPSAVCPCPRLQGRTGACNGCSRRRYHCSYRPRAAYLASYAQRMADEELSAARSGIDETEESAARKLSVIRSDLARGLSPEQISEMRSEELGLSRSTIYRWIAAGYGGMSEMDLRRQVGYRKRDRSAPRRSTPHSAARSHDAFLALPADVRDGAWEMDEVVGTKDDSLRLLTLFHRPSRLQLFLPVPDATCASVVAGLGLLGGALGDDAVRRVLGCVLTDNGAEFSDEAAIASALRERPGETRLFYCDPRQSQQKGGCERNHVELRKLLPKGEGIRFDRLTTADCALLMSQANSEPRGALGWLTPIAAFRAMLGEDADALLDALGVEEVPFEGLDLTPGCLERARAERGDGPLR